MTKTQFIASVEAKPNFIKWAVVPALQETLGEVEKWKGIAYITTPDGTNTFNVWFMHDTATSLATWQTADTMEPAENVVAKKIKVLNDYIQANFLGGFLVGNHVDVDNNYCEAEVFVDGATVTKKSVFIYKPSGQPLTHKDIV